MSTKTTALLDELIVCQHHTAVCVEDFDAAQSFFCDVIGMRLENEADYRDEEMLGTVVGLPGAVIRWAMLERDNRRIEMFKYYTPAGNTVNIKQSDRGITHLAFLVSDVDEVYRRIKGAGYRAYSEPQDLRGGITRPFYVEGPEGIVVEFLEIRQ